jgi:Polyketide cyclase / dehydrase and lipid transport
MLLKIIIVVAVLLAIVLAFAATKPKIFSVQRSINIKASPDKIFPLINDFHNWGGWAPQDKEDRTMKRTYSGAVNGEGAVSEWVSSGSAGKGRMTIIKSTRPRMISVQVEFVKPFEAQNVNEFTLGPNGDFTTVTWAMHGTNLYVMKLMSIFTNMDSVVGKHFERGLGNLKAVAEQ